MEIVYLTWSYSFMFFPVKLLSLEYETANFQKFSELPT